MTEAFWTGSVVMREMGGEIVHEGPRRVKQMRTRNRAGSTQEALPS
jgi:hypothetical protein